MMRICSVHWVVKISVINCCQAISVHSVDQQQSDVQPEREVCGRSRLALLLGRDGDRASSDRPHSRMAVPHLRIPFARRFLDQRPFSFPLPVLIAPDDVVQLNASIEPWLVDGRQPEWTTILFAFASACIACADLCLVARCMANSRAALLHRLMLVALCLQSIRYARTCTTEVGA